MEIPYIVNARKDTGLYNAKIAVWLFLASEVMLFGGLFSAYIFLRVFADYPWPERALPVMPGLINTFILIASSVTVVFAWASLKLRNWKGFVINMSITLICASVFLVFKVFEYKAKFSHQAVQTSDFVMIEGHLDSHKKSQEGYDLHYMVAPKEGEITYQLVLSTYYKPYLESVMHQLGDTKLVLKEDYIATVHEKQGGKTLATDKVLAPAGSELSFELLEKLKAYYIKARTENATIAADISREAWYLTRKDSSVNDLKDWNAKKIAAKDEYIGKLTEQAKANNLLYTLKNDIQFTAKTDKSIAFDSKWGRMSDRKEGQTTSLKLKDSSVISGLAGNSNVGIYVDAIDFRQLVMRAREKNLDIDQQIAKSPILNMEGPNGDRIRKIWACHEKHVASFAQHLLEKGGLNDEGEASLVPTDVDRYRVTWKEMVAYKELGYDASKCDWKTVASKEPNMLKFEGFTGPDHHKYNPYKEGHGHDGHHEVDMEKAHFPKVEIPRELVRFESVFSPKMNTYYAIYFTITGLHGLHVIGGMIVLGYYLFFGYSMYKKNPEWLANRVEVGGLFWHFVDLVWIFVFPIFYLM